MHQVVPSLAGQTSTCPSSQLEHHWGGLCEARGHHSIDSWRDSQRGFVACDRHVAAVNTDAPIVRGVRQIQIVVHANALESQLNFFT